MAVATGGFFVIASARGELAWPHTGVVWYAILVTGIFAGAFGYLVATWVQARTTAARAALVFTLEAPFAALFGVVLLSERLGWIGWTGCAVMLAGIVIAEPAAAAHAPAPRRAAGRGLMDAIALACASAGLFGSMAVLTRVALDRGGGAEQGALAIIGTALVVIAVYVVARGEWGLPNAWPFLLAGVLAPGCSQIMFTTAIRDVGASRASVVIGTAPLFAVAIAFVYLGEPVIAGVVVGAVLIVAGGVLLLSERQRPAHFRLAGLGLALAATMIFATRDSLIRRIGVHAAHIDPGLAAFATMLSGAATLVAFALVRKRSLELVVYGRLPRRGSASGSRTSCCSRRSTAVACRSSRRSWRPRRSGRSVSR